MLGPLVFAMCLGPEASGSVAPDVSGGEAPRGAIEWSAPAECPDDAALEARIATYLEVVDGARTTQATVLRVGEGFEVELVDVIEGEPQRRTLSAPTCEVLADAVAVVVALALDPDAMTESEPEAAEEPPSAAVVLPIDATRSSSRRGRAGAPPVAELPRRSPWDIAMRFEVGYGSGVAPVGSAVLGGTLAAGRGRGAIEVTGRLWAPRSFDEPDGLYGARVVLGTGAVLGCLRARPGKTVEFPLCLGIEGGALGATPLRLDTSRRQRYPWVAAIARLGMRIRLAERAGLVLTLEGGAPFVRDAIDVGGADRLWVTRTASGRVFAGIEVRWGGPGTERGR